MPSKVLGAATANVRTIICDIVGAIKPVRPTIWVSN